MVGIYSITSPSGKVYVGQSWDIKKRHTFYKSTLAKDQPYLNNSFTKYGFDSHEIKILHELPKDVKQDVLDKYEQLYMDSYRGCGIVLLNCKEAGNNGKAHPETIRKRVEKNTGQKRSLATKLQMSESAKKVVKTSEWMKKICVSRKANGFVPWVVGKKMSDETNKKNSVARKKWCDENPDEVKKKVSLMNDAISKPVIQLSKSGEFIKNWKSAREAERGLGIFSTSIAASIRGVRCKHAGGFKWKYC